MHEFIEKVTRSQYLQGVFSLSAGAFIGQVINFFANLVIARLYDPEEYGLFAIYNYFLGISLIFGCFKLNISIVTTGEDATARTYMGAGVVAGFVMSIIATLGFTIYVIWGELPLSPAWFLIFLVAYNANVIYYINWSVLLRLGEHRMQGLLKIAESIFSGLGTIAFSWLNAMGLALGYLISYLAIVAGSFKKTDVFAATKEFLLHKTVKSVIPEIRSNIYIVLQALLEMLQFALVPFLFSEEKHLVGLYYMSIKVLQTPARILVIPLAQVFMTRASRHFHDGRPLRKFFLKNLFLIAFTSIPSSLAILLGGKYVFPILLGKQWADIYIVINVILPWLLADIVRIPFAQLFFVFKKQKIYSLFYMIMIIALLLCYTAGEILKDTPLQTLGLIAMVEAVIIVGIVAYTYFMTISFDRSLHLRRV